MATESELQAFRDFVESLPEDKRQEFRARFNSLQSPEEKQATIDRVLAKAGTRQDSLVTQAKIPTALAGPTGFGSVEGSEDILPAAGQAAGTPFGLIGSTAGATLGQAVRQGVRGLRGRGVDLSQIPKEALTTLTSEGLLRLPGKVFFRKQIGGKAKDIAGREVGRLAKQVKENAQFAGIGKKRIIQKIDLAIKDIPFEQGVARTNLIKLRNNLENAKGALPFEKARQVEQRLGQIAQFAKESSQGRFPISPKTPKLNEKIKQLRAFVSAKVDEAASKANVPQFEGASKKFSRLASKFPEKELQKRSIPLRTQIIGGAVGSVGALAPALKEGGEVDTKGLALIAPFFVPQAARTAAFRSGVPQALGNIGRIGAAEIARRLREAG